MITIYMDKEVDEIGRTIYLTYKRDSYVLRHFDLYLTC